MKSFRWLWLIWLLWGLIIILSMSSADSTPHIFRIDIAGNIEHDFKKKQSKGTFCVLPSCSTSFNIDEDRFCWISQNRF